MEMIEGKYGVFYLEPQDRRDHAQTLLKYFDRKYPEVYDSLKVRIVETPKVRLKFTEGTDCAACDPRGRVIGWCRGNRDADLGGLIHETIHCVQVYPDPFYSTQIGFFITEGVADYYRILLSDDRNGDFGSDDHVCLKAVFEKSDAYNCGSEFVAYLNRKSGFILDMIGLLSRGDCQGFNDLFPRFFGKDLDGVLMDYTRARPQLIGAEPSQTRRYDYYMRLAADPK